MKSIQRLALVLAVLALAACGRGNIRDAAHAPAPGSATVGALHAGAHDNLNAVLWMQVATEYEASLRTVYNAAGDVLDRALADRSWDALPRVERGGQRVENLPPAIILDADETVIDNSAYQARLIARGETFDAVTWEAFVNERRSLALPGAREFLLAAAQRGVTVFYVTNRSAAEKPATYDNLRALGFPMSDPEDTVLTIDEAQGWSPDKSTRRQFVGERYRVLMLFGDNLGDFVDGHRGKSNAERTALVEGYRDWWGERWFMLPNPSYGGWEGATTRGADDPNAAKRRALRTR